MVRERWFAQTMRHVSAGMCKSYRGRACIVQKTVLCNLIVGALLLLPVNRRHSMVGDASGPGEGGFPK